MTPDEHTIQETFLEVGNGHTLYVQEWGNPNGAPIMFLHGGPGAAATNQHRSALDPTQHRVIFFDQRGCGRSLPHGSLEHNTTADIIADIEKIAAHLKLKQFVITGGSWGSCLALAYALQHPERVRAMVLSGIFTGAQAEIDYFDKGEFRTYFPEVWERYLATVPASHHANPTKYHYERVLKGSEQAARESAYALENMEGALLSLDERFMSQPFSDFDPTGAFIEAHYLANGCFMPDRHIFKNAQKLTMPIWMVQGRYDFVCPPITAHELHKVLPNSQLVYTIAGHRGSERATQDVIRGLLLQFVKA
jgi:proline iminopeptidase